MNYIEQIKQENMEYKLHFCNQVPCLLQTKEIVDVLNCACESHYIHKESKENKIVKKDKE